MFINLFQNPTHANNTTFAYYTCQVEIKYGDGFNTSNTARNGVNEKDTDNNKRQRKNGNNTG